MIIQRIMIKKTIKRKRLIISPVKRKFLLLLAAGFALSFSRSIGRQLKILEDVPREWREIDRQYLYRLVREFKDERLVDYREETDGSISVVLTDKGKLKTLRFNMDLMRIDKPSRWDGFWRIVFFDVPEKRRKARDALRDKLKELNFHELQKSVFIHPYPCQDQINFIVEFFEIRNSVRLAEAKNITNESELKLHFGLK